MDAASKTEVEIARHILETFEDVETQESCGYTFFFVGEYRMLPFVTLIGADTDYDQVSDLDRPGVYRLNIGVRKETFRSLFGEGKVDTSGFDYRTLDTIMPHPDYAPQHWVCVLNPSDTTWETVQSLLAEAYDMGATKMRKSRNTGES
jgi:hypothetical protein